MKVTLELFGVRPDDGLDEVDHAVVLEIVGVAVSEHIVPSEYARFMGGTDVIGCSRDVPQDHPFFATLCRHFSLIRFALANLKRFVRPHVKVCHPKLFVQRRYLINHVFDQRPRFFISEAKHLE